MLRALCLAMTILVVPVEVASAAAPSDLGANAALKYWQAFSALPKFTDAEQTKIHEYLTAPLDEHAREIVSQAGRQFDPDVVEAFRAREGSLRDLSREPLKQLVM